MDRAVRRNGEKLILERRTWHMLRVDEGSEAESSGKSTRSGQNVSDYRWVNVGGQNFLSKTILNYNLKELWLYETDTSQWRNNFSVEVLKRICDGRPNSEKFVMPRQNKITKTLGSILQKPHKEWRDLKDQGVTQVDTNATMSVSNSAIVS